MGGVGITFSKSFTPDSLEVEEVVEGRLLVVRAEVEQFYFVFMNVHAPVSGPDRVRFFKVLDTVLRKVQFDEFLFLGGDFNCTENDVLDRNHLEPHSASQRALRQLLQTHDLCDVWRRLHDDKRQYTWTHCRENLISMARLDRFYCFKHNLNIFRKCSIFPVGFTDHAMVACNVFISKLKSRSAYWHFNTSLLCDAHFKDVFKFFWSSFKGSKSDFISLKLWWDCGKVEIKQLCQQYTLNVTRDIARSMKDLETEIVEVLNLIDSTGNRDHIKDLKSKKSTLSDLLGTKAQGALVRSRFQSAALMDTPSKFFFGLEKKNGQNKTIHTLRSAEGEEISENTEIRRRAVSFYKDLNKSEYVENIELYETFCGELPKIPKDINTGLDGPLTLQELHTALQSMEGGKAPGIDGIPVEFYKDFWNDMGEDLLSVFNESFKDLVLPISCRRAVITLLPKKGDLLEIKNWRPVSLLCTDYKILSKVLANRLRDVMGEVLHPDQTYCVPGRSILDNVSLIRDVVDLSSSLDIKAGLISLDQEKAFDRVEHLYLWKTLESFGLSPCLIAMIKVLYQDIESVLKINGGLSAPFKVHRGVRQGCSLSGMLYALSIEPMLRKLRANIEGLILSDFRKSPILSSYADDIIVFVKNQKEINELGRIVNEFKTVSAARVNWGKSEALAVGSWEGGLPSLPGGLKWRRDGLKYLGVHIGNESIVKKNWEGVEEKIKGSIDKWKWLKPQLSYRGRTLITNNLVASALWHRLACMEPPRGLIQRIQAILTNFIWDRLHWVPQCVLFLPTEEGGQGLVHIQSRVATFRIQFIQRYLAGPQDVVWRQITNNILRGATGQVLEMALFLMDFKLLKLHGLSPFYQSLLKTWHLFKWRRPEQTNSLHWLLEEPLIHGARLDVTTAQHQASPVCCARQER